MKKIIKYLPVLLISLLFTSCLESGLDELPAYSDAEITNMRFEYRWVDKSNTYDKMQVVQLLCDATIDQATNTVNCIVSVPAANNQFSETERSNVTATNIVGYADISPAAVMAAVSGSTTLGIPGDFSKANQYQVEAADGESVKVWTITVTEFNK